MSLDELIELTGDLDRMLQAIRKERNIKSPMIWCPKCQSLLSRPLHRECRCGQRSLPSGGMASLHRKRLRPGRSGGRSTARNNISTCLVAPLLIQVRRTVTTLPNDEVESPPNPAAAIGRHGGSEPHLVWADHPIELHLGDIPWVRPCVGSVTIGDTAMWGPTSDERPSRSSRQTIDAFVPKWKMTSYEDRLAIHHQQIGIGENGTRSYRRS